MIRPCFKLIGCFRLRHSPFHSFLCCCRLFLLFLFPLSAAPLSVITGLVSSLLLFSLPPQTDGGWYEGGWEEKKSWMRKSKAKQRVKEEQEWERGGRRVPGLRPTNRSWLFSPAYHYAFFTFSSSLMGFSKGVQQTTREGHKIMKIKSDLWGWVQAKKRLKRMGFRAEGVMQRQNKVQWKNLNGRKLTSK